MTQTATDAVKVPMDVTYKPGWLTMVSSIEACLTALGTEVDVVDVAGMSGYAFVFNVEKELYPSGPTAFKWGNLLTGLNSLGRTTSLIMGANFYNKEKGSEIAKVHAKQVFEFCEREIREGRPCVLWGTYLPEFGVVTGIDNGKFIVKSFKGNMGKEEPPIPWDEIDYPGGTFALSFPAESDTLEFKWSDKFAIHQALKNMSKHSDFPNYSTGKRAYKAWIHFLKNWEKSEKKDICAFGNAYNAQCWAEAKEFAKAFLVRIAERNEAVQEPLMKASGHFDDVVEQMKRVAGIFSFPANVDQLNNEDNRMAAIGALREAKESEKKSKDYLKQALKMDWQSS
jgi:hypothetical protein